MFVEAIKYLRKLIRIRKKMIKKGFKGNDNAEIIQTIDFIEKHLNYHAQKYCSDERMHNFFDRHHDRIRLLIPGDDYPGFQKLMNEFINLQNQ